MEFCIEFLSKSIFCGRWELSIRLATSVYPQDRAINVKLVGGGGGGGGRGHWDFLGFRKLKRGRISNSWVHEQTDIVELWTRQHIVRRLLFSLIARSLTPQLRRTSEPHPADARDKNICSWNWWCRNERNYSRVRQTIFDFLPRLPFTLRGLSQRRRLNVDSRD